MQEGLHDRVRAGLRWLRRLERREVRGFRAWIENTQNLIHVSVLLFVPFLMGAVTLLSGQLRQLSFLLFPPLASGTYTLFSNPDGKYASPKRFVGGLTAGAVCGLLALHAGSAVHGTPVDALQVDAAGAALAVFLAGALTWAGDLEEPAAFSTALLVLVTKTDKLTYVASVATSSILVAGVFMLWRERFFEERARYLYTSTRGDDRVLVPMRGDHPETTARLGTRLAAAHDSAKVVLLGLVDTDDVEADDTSLTDIRDHDPGESVATDGSGDPRSAGGEEPVDGVGASDGGTGPADGGQAADEGEGTVQAGEPGPTTARGRAAVPEPGERATGTDPAGAEAREPSSEPGTESEGDPETLATAASAMSLEELAADLETVYGVPCEVLVAESSNAPPGTPIIQAAHDTGCDLIATPYETDAADERLAPYIHELFHSDTDTLVHRSAGTGAGVDGDWQDVLVPARRAGDVAHKMIDFAARLAGDRGRVSICHCIQDEDDRERAERLLSDLAETVTRGVETHVPRADIDSYLQRVSSSYDLVIIGSSGDRSAASRFVSRPTFERIEELDCDFAVLDRNFRL